MGIQILRRLLGVCLLGCAAHAQPFDVTGVVQDAAGQAVTKAAVWLNQDRSPKKTETDASGRFGFSGVGIGPIELTAWKEGYAVGGLDAKVVGSADVVIELSNPDTVQVQLIERAMRPETSPSAPPRAVSGARIRSMFINDAFHVPVEDLVPLGFPASRSDETGALTISNLPRGGYLSFVITHREYTEVRIPYYPVGKKELAVQLARGVTLTGRVTDSQGAPVEGVRVTVYHAGPQLQEAKEVMTSADGFYVAVVPLGDFYVWARRRGSVCPKPAPLALTADKEDYVCDLTLEDAYRIRGRVTGPTDKPVAGVKTQYVVDGLVMDETLTANDGEFALEAGPGSGQVHVTPPDGFISEYVRDIPITMASEDLRIEQPVRLRELPVIAGTVLDSGGMPAPKAAVSAIDAEPPAWCVTDEKGQFRLRLERAPLDGKVRVVAEHGYRFERADFGVSLDSISEVTIKLVPFEPDTSECRPERVTNKLASYRDRPAKALICDRWFNVSPELQDKPDAVTLESLRGKVVVLVFWAEFDKTQRGELALTQMNTLHELFADASDVAIVGIHDSGSETQEIAEALRATNSRFATGHDRESRTFSAYNIYAIPQIILIDKKGILRYYDVDGRLLELIKSLRREGLE